MQAAAPSFANINGKDTGSIIPAVPTPSALGPVAPTAAQLAARTSATQPTYGSVSTTDQKQPPTQPAVLSSTTIDNDVIPKNNQALDSLSAKGTYVGADGYMRYADGSMVPAPVGAESTGENGGWSAGGMSYGAEPQYEQVDPNDPGAAETQKVNDLLAGMKMSADASTKSQLDTIEQQHALLTSAQTGANRNALLAKTTSLLNTGGRYAPMDTSNGILTETSMGLQRLAALDATENSQIATVRKAQADGDMQLMDKALADVQATRTAKQTAAQKVIDAQQTALQTQQKQQIQASRDTAVADLVNQGLTDPAKILEALNEDPNAGASGGDFTSDEIATTLKNIAASTGAAGIKGLTGDVGNFYALKATPGALPSSILALPADQQLAAYVSMVNQAKKGVLGTPTSAGGTSDVASSIVGATVPAVQMSSTGNPDPYTQSAFLNALPGGETGDAATLVKGLADYSVNPSAFSTRQYKGVSGMTTSQVIALAKQYDPTYDEKQYATRAAMQKYITTGAGAQTITAANTLIKHLQLLSDSAKKLPGHSFTPLNTAGNFLNTVGGRNVVTNFNTEAQAVASEAAKVYKGSGSPAEGEIQQFQKDFNADMSPDQLQGAIKAMIDLMAGKLSTLSDNYTSTMGKPGDYRVLTPDAATALTNMGFDPSNVDPNYTINQPDIGSSSSLSSFLSSAPATGAVSAPINWNASGATQ